jgi:hypothetical protein
MKYFQIHPGTMQRMEMEAGANDWSKIFSTSKGPIFDYYISVAIKDKKLTEIC